MHVVKKGATKKRTKVSDLTKTRKLEELESVQIEEYEGEGVQVTHPHVVVVTPGTLFYTTHAGIDLDNRPKDGSLYWKARVESIHKDDKNCYLIIKWFYSRNDFNDTKINKEAKALIDNLGSTELVFSNHEDVIDADCFEDVLYIHEYDDKKSGRRFIDTRWWYTRFTISFSNGTGKIKNPSFHCVCNDPYNPDKDMQRFCRKCETWFDVDCIKPENGKAPERLGGTALQQVANMPILRGKLPSDADEWRIVGSGSSVEAAKRLVESLDAGFRLPRDWRSKVGEPLINFAKITYFSFYLCPYCSDPENLI